MGQAGRDLNEDVVDGIGIGSEGRGGVGEIDDWEREGRDSERQAR